MEPSRIGALSGELTTASTAGATAVSPAGTTAVSTPPPPGPEQPRLLKPWETLVVSAWLVLLTGATVAGLLSVWPLAEQVRATAAKAVAPGAASPEPPRLDLLVAHPLLTIDVSLIVIAMLAGVLGSLVHTFTWLNHSGGTPPADGRRTHTTHDAVWFLTAPIQGGLLASVVLAAVAAGLLSAGQSQAAGTISLFTIAALGSLTGLFSRRITAKLAQVVNRIGPPASTTILHPAGTSTTTTTTTDQATVDAG